MLVGGGGSIVNTASTAGLIGIPAMAPYTFSKAGVVGLTRAAAIEYADRGIRVNAVAPTGILTGITERLISISADPEGHRRRMASHNPIPGQPVPGDVAAAVAFLASDDARWITGHTIPVDGGTAAR